MGKKHTGRIIHAAVGVVLALALGLIALVLYRAGLTGGPGRPLGSEYQYDLAKYRHVDPKLILYEEDASLRTALPLREPRGLAVGPGGRVYVVGDESLVLFDRIGGRASRTHLDARATCAAADRNGDIYAATAWEVHVLDGRGTPRRSWSAIDPKDHKASVPRTLLTSIAVTKEGVFVADAGNRIVRRYDKLGRLLGRIGQKDPLQGVPGFVVPSPHFDLAMGADGLLRVANPGRHRIETYTVEGDYELLPWGQSGNEIDKFCGCCNPISFAILPDGGFVTAEKGLKRVKVYDEDGKFVGVVAAPDRFSQHDEVGGCAPGEAVLDLAVDESGRVLVLDPDSRAVRVFVRRSDVGGAK